MSNKKHIVLIPYWVQETLMRNNLALADCLDLAKIRPLMSLSDLLMFAAMDQFQETVMGSTNLHEPQASILESMIWRWSAGIPEGSQELKDFCWKTVSTLSKDLSIKNELKARLFCEDAKTSQYEKPFITYDLTPDVCGVVIFPGFFTDSGKREFQKPLVEETLKLSYVYESSHEVAKTPLFKRYLDLLAA